MGVAMTVPQMRRRECSVDGKRWRLAPGVHRLLVILMLADPDLVVSYEDLVEMMWPDPDTQPLTAVMVIHAYMQTLRRVGVTIETERGRGLRIARESRGVDIYVNNEQSDVIVWQSPSIVGLNRSRGTPSKLVVARGNSSCDQAPGLEAGAAAWNRWRRAVMRQHAAI